MMRDKSQETKVQDSVTYTDDNDDNIDALLVSLARRKELLERILSGMSSKAKRYAELKDIHKLIQDIIADANVTRSVIFSPKVFLEKINQLPEFKKLLKQEKEEEEKAVKAAAKAAKAAAKEAAKLQAFTKAQEEYLQTYLRAKEGMEQAAKAAENAAKFAGTAAIAAEQATKAATQVAEAAEQAAKAAAEQAAGEQAAKLAAKPAQKQPSFFGKVKVTKGIIYSADLPARAEPLTEKQKKAVDKGLNNNML